MTIYEKWRELSIDPFAVPFKNIKIENVISYPYAQNDVVEVKCLYNNKLINAIIKIERSKMADFEREIETLKKLEKHNDIKTPKIIETLDYSNKKIIVLEKILGNRLSDIFRTPITIAEKKQYIVNYGKELARIHQIKIESEKIAKQRPINDYPKETDYKINDCIIKKCVDYLKNNKPDIKLDTFIHGDFHYGNILWINQTISGILDWEYSGAGFKEQDIAWAIILRPNQEFMDNFEDINDFLKGYSSIGEYDSNKLKWCLINGWCHFYLMNTNNHEYTENLKKLLDYAVNVERFN